MARIGALKRRDRIRLSSTEMSEQALWSLVDGNRRSVLLGIITQKKASATLTCEGRNK